MADDAGAAAAAQDANAAAQAGTAAGGQAPDWLGSLPPDLKGLAEAKGWRDPAHALQGYQGLEKLLGADRAGRTVVLPKDGDEAAKDAFFGRIGRPETAEGYELAKRDGVDPDFGGKAAAVMHRAGLTKDQAGALAEWFTAEQAAAQAGVDDAFARRSEAEMQELTAEWGEGAHARMETARRYAKVAGFDGAELDAIERAIGTKAMLSRFDAAGKALMEDRPPAGSGGAEPATPAAATGRLQAMLADPAKVEALMNKGHPGHAAAVAEKARLDGVIAGVPAS
ncbi:MAG: hypothetical protein KDG89_06780 [Geminicoccaceae bacterium]|nr:hypothetical protein [Geminicoccaceae bacterium]